MAVEEHGSSSSDSWIVRMLQCRICSSTRQRLEGFNDMEILAKLGQGAFGKVFRCRDRKTGRLVAVKQIEIPPGLTMITRSIKMTREMDLLKKVLDHDNIVRLLYHVVTEDKKYLYLVFEHLDCDLHQYIREHSHTVDPAIRKNFLRQILTGVAYCHANQILHRDLKLKNLLMDRSKNIIKLADFGLARALGDPAQHSQNLGTRWYRAPELLFGLPYSTPVDLWSVGCIFGEMVIGNPIFKALHFVDDELEAIFRVLGTPTEETWPGVTSFNDFQNIRQYKPLDLETIFADLGTAGLDLLTSMLCLDPSKRISAEAALEHAYFND
ncbi:cell division control protein 2 homolog [Lotus japonicus]|uniref:cell division control protein 2 homolog n=1 Tax=Lotus japonicus TaxID=34305 RepID=UPI00258CB140|nr:cell division control protein 2 homolog [Lotus japonicus]